MAGALLSLLTRLHKRLKGHHHCQDEEPSWSQPAVDVPQDAQGLVTPVKQIQAGNDVVGVGLTVPLVCIQDSKEKPEMGPYRWILTRGGSLGTRGPIVLPSVRSHL